MLSCYEASHSSASGASEMLPIVLLMRRNVCESPFCVTGATHEIHYLVAPKTCNKISRKWKLLVKSPGVVETGFARRSKTHFGIELVCCRRGNKPSWRRMDCLSPFFYLSIHDAEDAARGLPLSSQSSSGLFPLSICNLALSTKLSQSHFCEFSFDGQFQPLHLHQQNSQLSVRDRSNDFSRQMRPTMRPLMGMGGRAR